MVIFGIVGTEANPVYQMCEVQNLARQYDFLYTAFNAALQLDQQGFSEHLLRALNAHAIACLHEHAGLYRPVPVIIRNCPHIPPPPEDVADLMAGFVAEVKDVWETRDPLELAAFVLWRLNWIHPFVNGNGRTARASAYYVLCRKLGLWLPGNTIIPELIRGDPQPYYEGLRHADESYKAGSVDLAPLRNYLSGLLTQQLQTRSAG